MNTNFVLNFSLVCGSYLKKRKVSGQDYDGGGGREEHEKVKLINSKGIDKDFRDLN